MLLLCLSVGFLLGFPPNTSLASTGSSLEFQRALFRQAETAFMTGQNTRFAELKKKLINYPLYPYLVYGEYDKRMSNLTLSEFQSFMDKYNDTVLAEQLRSRWLQTKAKQERWNDFMKAYQPTEDVSLQCHYLWAELQSQKNTENTLDQINTLWLSGKQHPKSCEAPFAVYEKSKRMTRPLVWQRVKQLLQAGNEKLARKTAKHLKKTEIALVELWIMVRNNPYLVTHRQYFKGDHPAYLEMLVDGVSLIAKTKPDVAIQIWQQIGHQYPFTERHWGLVVRAIGLTFAHQRNPNAEKWLSKVPNIYANDAVHEWRIRVALMQENWQTVLRWMKTLPEKLARSEEWQYWHARSLAMMGQHKESQTILAKLSTLRSYYGFLASHHLKKPFAIARQKINVDQALQTSLSARPSIQRAHELYALGRTQKARQEWQFVTSNLNDKERHAAASIAMQWGLPNWSILALSKAQNKNDLDLRFPVTYSKQILNEAKRHQIDPAWIFAVTRQESAFVPQARSSAGALGLMQLMPGTAQMVAKKHQIPLRNGQGVIEPTTNIQLGSGYLKMMLDGNQKNAILATAAYNAGPGRVRQWLPNANMSADIWVETIPFKETREYVKNVTTYMIIYQEILGKKPSLHPHMPHIAAKL